MKFEINSQNLFCSKCRYNIQKNQRDFGIALGSRSVLRGRGDWHFVPTPGKVFVNLFQKVVGWRGKAPLPAAAGGILTKKRSGREMKQSGGLVHRGKPYPGVSRCPGGTGWRLALRVNSWKSSLPVSSETGISQLAQRNRCSSGGVEIDAAHQLLEKGLVRHKGDVHFTADAVKPAFFRLGGDWRFAPTPGRMDTARKGWILLSPRLCLRVCWRKRPTCGVAHTGAP